MTPQITPADLLNTGILPHWPKPADTYEQALWCEDLENALAALIPLMNTQYHTAVTAIITNNLRHPQYELLQPQTPYRRINLDLLKTNAHDIYQKIIHLKAHDAEKIIGRTELYHIARKTDPEQTDALACANITDLAKILRPEELEPYLITRYKPARPRIIPRRTA
ncbi:hypothetical protein O0S10_10450 [Methanocorpusculum sp. MG]|uniref:Uncharacterized protein n=1 Tax=Methanocorpusculum petauri TaxID=3002863 RepID=A0ABT4IIQ8_9EURY|nr:hypothetical protein [Methanocorpusculum petauri]MCZ0861628.1 hypothetical protein [Methanocorpusculum petauri]